MLLETLGYVVLGTAVGFAATRALPDRFPSALLVKITGPCAALLGGWIAGWVMGPGHVAATMAVATAVSVALVTLLIKPRPQRTGAPRARAGRARAA